MKEFWICDMRTVCVQILLKFFQQILTFVELSLAFVFWLQGYFFMYMLVFLFSEFSKIVKSTQLGCLQRAIIHNPMAEKCSNSGFAIQNTPKSG